MNSTKQVIVMRKDLGMRKGKMITQGAHASMAFLTSNMGIRKQYGNIYVGSTMLEPVHIEWLNSSFKKICVYVNSEEELLAVYEKAQQARVTAHMITDAGHTEFGGVPTRTCCAIGPDFDEEIDKITGHLPLL